MPGFTRRSKPIKGAVALSDITNFSISNPSDNDLIAFDSGSGLWVNTKSLTGDYSIVGSLTVNSIVLQDGISLGSDIVATGDLDIGGNGEIDGTLVVGGATTVSSLSVTLGATVGTTLDVAGTLSGAGFSFSGAGTVGGNLAVTGTLSAGALSLTDLSLAGDLTVGGISTFLDIVSMADDLNVIGTLSGQAISGTSIGSTGTLSFNTTFSGPRFNISRSSPDIIWQNTTDDDTILFRGAYNIGAGQVLTDMLKLTPNVGGTLTGDLTVTGDADVTGTVQAAFLSAGDRSELTISGGAVTATQGFHDIDTEADAATDDLDTINFTGNTGSLLIIQSEDTARTVVCKDGTGNLRLAGDFSLTHNNDKLMLVWAGSVWHEIARSDNAT